MLGKIGGITGAISPKDTQKFIVHQTLDSWVYYTWSTHWSERKQDFEPSHRDIARGYGLPVEFPLRYRIRPDGVVEEMAFNAPPLVFEGIIGGGFTHLEVSEQGLVVCLYDRSLSYGPLSRTVFSSLHKSLLGSYQKMVPQLIDVILKE